MLYYCTTCFHPTKIIEFGALRMSVSLNTDSKLFVALMCSSAWTRGKLQQQQYSKWHIPRRKLFKHLSIAQHLFLLWFCCFDFVYSSLSRSAGFILCCLNLFPTTVIPQHKRMKETLNEKHNLFILGMSQLPGQHYWARCMCFFPQALRGSSSGLNQRMYWLWHVYFHGKDMLGFQQDQHI